MAELIATYSQPEKGYHVYRSDATEQQVFVSDAEVDEANVAQVRKTWDEGQEAQAREARRQGQPFARQDPGTVTPTANVDGRRRIALELGQVKLEAATKKGRKAADVAAPPAP